MYNRLCKEHVWNKKQNSYKEATMIFERTEKFPKDFVFKEGLCVSLFLKTHRHSPDNKKDALMFKNLVKKTKTHIDKKFPDSNTDDLYSKLDALIKDNLFWKDTKDGLAMFANEEAIHYYFLDDDVPTDVYVENKFRVIPLIDYFQASDQFYLLALGAEDYKLYRGNRTLMEKVDIPDDHPKTMNEVLGEEHPDKYLTHGTYAGGDKNMFHGHGGEKDESGVDRRRYFRFVNDYVTDNYLNDTEMPLILVSLKEHQGTFKKVSDNKHLVHTIDMQYTAKNKNKIHELVNAFLKERHQEKIKNLLNDFYTAKSNGRASDLLSEVAMAATQAKIDTLFIEKGKEFPGIFHKDTGELEYGEDKDYGADIYDDLAKDTLEKDGVVYIVDQEDMPGESGICVIYRY